VLISPSPLIFVESQQYEIKTVDRFKAKVEVDNDGCHLWTGCLDKNGYGFFNMGRPKRLRRAQARQGRNRLLQVPVLPVLAPNQPAAAPHQLIIRS
jgi:hypothetical protein